MFNVHKNNFIYCSLFSSDKSLEDQDYYARQVARVRTFFYLTRRVPGTSEPLYCHVSNKRFDRGKDSSFGGRAFDLFRPCKDTDTCKKCSKCL